MALALLLSGHGGLFAQNAAAKEYQIKAAFLYNFAQFVEWPAEMFPDPQGPLVIGILGQDPFGATLDEIVQGEKVNNHPLAVQRFSRPEEIKNCHVLFVSQSEAGRLDKIFASQKNRSVLTVGDFEGFALHGGVIRFITEQNKIRLRINLEAAKSANLTISSKLLRIADVDRQ